MKEWKIVGGKAIAMCTPDEHFVQVAEHILSTLPRAHICYKENYGFDYASVLGNPLLMPVLELKLTKMLSESLEAEGIDVIKVKFNVIGTKLEVTVESRRGNDYYELRRVI